MRPVTELLESLRAREINIWLAGETVRFEGPKGAIATQDFAELQARKAEVIEALAAEHRPAFAPIAPYKRPSRIPLTASQQTWFTPQAPDYVPPELRRTPVAFRFWGPFSLEALIGSLEGLLLRHEILRTRYGHENGVSYQEVLERGDPMLRRFDLSEQPMEELQYMISRHMKKEFAKPPAYDDGRPLKAWLFCLRADLRVLVLIIDHIALDNLSLDIVLSELISHYHALANGEPPPPSEVGPQYADYAIRNQKQQSPTRLQHNEALWRERIGHRPFLDLRRGQTELSPAASDRGRAPIDVGPALSETVYAFARSRGCTIPIIMIAAVSALLAAWAARPDVLIGFVVDGRPPRMRQTVGSFVRTQPLMMDLAGDPTVAELLTRARRAHLDANDSERMVRTWAFPGLAQVILNVQTKPDRPVYLSREGATNDRSTEGKSAPRPQNATPCQLQIQPWRPSLPWTDHYGIDLNIFMIQKPGGLTGWVLFAADRMDGREVRRFSDNLAPLLEAMAANPDSRFSELMASVWRVEQPHAEVPADWPTPVGAH